MFPSWGEQFMKKTASLFAWSIVLVLLIGWAPTSEAQPTKWTSASGATVEATIADIQGDVVVLRPVEGDEVSIRINMLVPADQVRAREWQAGRTARGTEVEGGGEAMSNRLPTLAGTSHYVIFDAQNFDAVIDHSGEMTIHPKVDGKRFGESFTFAIPYIRYELREDRARWLRPSRFVRWDAPARNPQKISFEATREDPSPGHLSVEYLFEGNQVTAVIHLLETRRSASGLSGFSVSRFLPLAMLPPEYNVQQRRRAMEGKSLVYKDTRGRSVTPSLFDTGLRVDMDEVTFHGFWGPRVIRFTGDNRTRGNNTHIWAYPGKPLFEDFRIRHAVEAGARPGRLVLTIE